MVAGPSHVPQKEYVQHHQRSMKNAVAYIPFEIVIKNKWLLYRTSNYFKILIKRVTGQSEDRSQSPLYCFYPLKERLPTTKCGELLMDFSLTAWQAHLSFIIRAVAVTKCEKGNWCRLLHAGAELINLSFASFLNYSRELYPQVVSYWSPCRPWITTWIKTYSFRVTYKEPNNWNLADLFLLF